MVSLKLKGGKAGFFDSKEVLAALGRAKAKVFARVGAKVRAAAQKSLVYADGPSAPGKPPHAHKSRTRTRTSKKTGKTRTRSVSFLREFLYFSYDKTTSSVVVGPVKLQSTVDPKALPALEYGGAAVIMDKGKRVSVNIKARPFMGPAFEGMWKDSVRP